MFRLPSLPSLILLHRLFFPLVSFLIGFSSLLAQVAAPKQEVRAVWLTTAASLDWPKSQDKLEQQASLRRIIKNLRDARFNTIFFQARARGDAYYKSSYEPWAENLTGTLGKDPGWDPLAFLLNEAHAVGMEVHAWFNVYKIRGPAPLARSAPLHLTYSNPGWTITYEGDVWLDPGIPEVRSYLHRVAVELVRLYDIDGIHFDYIRYPGRNFPDAETHRRYGKGMTLEDWRRANIDAFVSDFYDAAMRIKPMLKVGSAPIGVFRIGTGQNGWGAFYSYYQDSQGWLHKGKHDYLAPQTYWGLGEAPDDPDFAALVRTWMQASAGRHVYAGIAAYKSKVARELRTQIDSARAIGVLGQSFFRYENVGDLQILGDRYATWATVPPMPWKDSIPPLPPTNIAVTESAPNVFHVEWTSPPPARDGDRARYYALYRATTPEIRFNEATSVVAVTLPGATHYIDTIKTPSSMTYYYAVSAFDKGNNESILPVPTSAVMKEMLEISGKLENITNLAASIGRNGNMEPLIAYRLADRMSVSLDVVDGMNGGAVVATLVQDVQDGGTYVLGLDRAKLKPGKYLIRLKADPTTRGRATPTLLEQVVELGNP